MARPKTPTVEITEGLQPRAQVLDTYVRAPSVPRSDLWRTAEALSKFNSALGTMFDGMEKQQNENAKLQAESDFWTGNSDAAAKATQDYQTSGGTIGIPPTANPMYSRTMSALQGQSAGVKFDAEFGQMYAEMPKNSDDPNAFDSFFASKVKEKFGGTSPQLMRGLAPQLARTHAKYSEMYLKDRVQDITKRYTDATVAAAAGFIDSYHLEGSKQADGTNSEALGATLSQVRDNALKGGGEKGAIDKAITDAVIAKAILYKDEKLLNSLDSIKDSANGVPLSKSDYGLEKVTSALRSIHTLKIQEQEQAYKLSQRQDKKEHDAALREVTKRLVDSQGRAEIPDELITPIEKTDPDARSALITLRKNVIDGTVQEDKERIAGITTRIMQGDKGAMWEGIKSGVIKDPATISKLYDLTTTADKVATASPGWMNNITYKSLDNQIRLKLADPKWKGSLFGEPGLTDAGRAAVQYLQEQTFNYIAKNPNPDPREFNKYLNELGESIFRNIDTSNEQSPKFTAPGGVPTDRSEVPAMRAGQNYAGGNPPSSGVQTWQDRLMNAPKPPKVEELQLNPLQRQLIDEAAKHNGVMAQDIIDKMWGSAQRLKNQSPTSPAAPNGQAPSANPESPAPGASGGASGGPPGAPVPPQGRPGDQRRGDIPANIDTASLVDEAIRTGRMTIDVPGLGRVSTEGLPTEALQAIQTAMRNVAPHITPAAFRMAYSGGDNSQLPTGGADSMQISKSRVDAIDRSPVGTIIDRVARETGLDPAMMKAIAHIESSGNPRAVTGSYRGLYQLSNEEFSRYGRGGDVFNAEDNAYAAAGSLKEKMARFRVNFGRDPSATELYLMHQQGEGGLRMHATHLDRPAWENMLATGEGKRKGEAWAKKAVWGNVPSDVRRNFDRDSMTSREFIAVWMSKIEGIPYRTALARVGGSKNTEVASR